MQIKTDVVVLTIKPLEFTCNVHMLVKDKVWWGPGMHGIGVCSGPRTLNIHHWTHGIF